MGGVVISISVSVGNTTNVLPPSFINSPGTMILNEKLLVEKELVSGVSYSKNEAKVTISGVPDIPGLKTREVLENENIKVAHMPERYSSVGVGEVFTKLNAVGKKAIIPRSGASTPFLKNLLEKIGINVVELYLYDVCAFRDPNEWNNFRQLFSQNKID